MSEVRPSASPLCRHVSLGVAPTGSLPRTPRTTSETVEASAGFHEISATDALRPTRTLSSTSPVERGSPVQAPLVQRSAVVHTLPSSHAVPLGRFEYAQAPVAVLHVPVRQSLESQTTGLDPEQAPDWQVSVRVQALASLQVVPSGLFGFEHVPLAGLQVPTSWHASLAVQTTGLEPVHVPDWQVSVRVHALPSLQLVPFDLAGFEQTPVAVLHAPTL